MSEIVISVENLSKVYRMYNKPIDRLKESLSMSKKVYHKPFYALKDVNFVLKKGESLGIVGKNGSGKSTLLKIITGVLSPSEGNVKTEGKISALLELGAGFNNDYTGMENIYLQGTIMGFSREEMETKVEEIIEFADIGDHINQPVKTYSSGMFVRLAFAVAISVNPDILIVDEALSVGDIRFQRKCFRKIEEFKKTKTFIFVSHDLSSINKFCDRVIWINEGKVIKDGAPESITKEFRAFMIEAKFNEHRQSLENNQTSIEEELGYELDPIPNDVEMMGDNKATFIGVGILNANRVKESSVDANDKMTIVLKYKANEDIDEAIIGFTIRNRLGNIIFQSNTFVIEQQLSLEAGQIYLSEFTFTLPKLIDGYYTVSPAIASGTMSYHTQHCWIYDAAIFQVLNKISINLEGFVYLDDIEHKLL